MQKLKTLGTKMNLYENFNYQNENFTIFRGLNVKEMKFYEQNINI
jgi:hypothetical protein